MSLQVLSATITQGNPQKAGCNNLVESALSSRHTSISHHQVISTYFLFHKVMKKL